MSPKISLFSYRVIELSFFGALLFFGYCIITLNLHCIAFLLTLTLLQLLIKGRSKLFVDLAVKFFRVSDFFKIKRYYEEPIPQSEKTLFLFHPHSVYGIGILFNLNHPNYKDEKMSNMVALASRFILNCPIFGAVFKWWGVVGCDSGNLKVLMKQGVDIGLVPGGYEEATITSHKEVRLYLQERKGFIKYAMKYGYTIRPVFIMNEHKAFQTYEGMEKFRLLLNKLKIPGVMYWNKSLGLLFPADYQLDTIIGKGIKSKTYEAGAQPTVQQIESMHSAYLKEVEQFYERHKEKNGNAPLKIV